MTKERILTSFISKLRRYYNQLLAMLEMRSNKLICRSRPYIIHLLGQYRCNYNCEFCGFDYHTDPLDRQLSFDNFRIVLNNSNPHLIKEVIFSGQGEPMLCFALPKISEFLRLKFPHIRQTINSNGALLNGPRWRAVSENIDEVIISLHSLDKKVYSKLTKKNTLEVVLRNIRELRENYPNLYITLFFAYSMRNITEIKSHVQFCYELKNCKYVGAYTRFYTLKKQFSDRTNKGADQSLDPNLSLYYHQDYSDKNVREAMKLADELGLDSPFFPPLFSNPHKHRYNCLFPYTQIMVNVDGSVFPCGGSDVWMYNDIVSGSLNFGNLITNRINEIWNGKDYLSLRASSHGNVRKRKIIHCENCSTLGFLVDSGSICATQFIDNTDRS